MAELFVIAAFKREHFGFRPLLPRGTVHARQTQMPEGYKLAAEQTGGTFSLVSQQAQREGDAHGTTVRATFDTAHVDCEPLGNIDETILTLMQGNPDLSLTYVYRTEAGEQRLSTDEMREILGDDVPLNSPDVLAWARSFLNGEE